MKIVQINCVYGKGSTGTLTRDLHLMLMARNCQSKVFYGRGDLSTDDGVCRVGGELLGKCNAFRSRMTGIPYGGCELNTARLIAEIHADIPDVVHLHCINGHFVNIYRLITYLKQQNIPTVLTLHAEFMYTANCSHAYDCEKWKTGCESCDDFQRADHSYFFDRTAWSWKRMAEAFDGFQRLSVIPVSPWQEQRAKCSPFFRSARIRTIINGLDLSVFHPMGNKTGDSGFRRIIYVTPNFDQTPGHIKGGEFIAPLAHMLGRQAQILVVGPGECRNLPDNVKVLGPIWDRKELARLYSEADITLLTSRRETFSMIVAESLCCGTPVVGFRAGGPESIALPQFSKFCEPGDMDSLAKTILSFPALDARTVGDAAARVYGKERMIEEYMDEYMKVRRHTE